MLGRVALRTLGRADVLGTCGRTGHVVSYVVWVSCVWGGTVCGGLGIPAGHPSVCARGESVGLSDTQSRACPL